MYARVTFSRHMTGRFLRCVLGTGFGLPARSARVHQQRRDPDRPERGAGARHSQSQRQDVQRPKGSRPSVPAHAPEPHRPPCPSPPRSHPPPAAMPNRHTTATAMFFVFCVRPLTVLIHIGRPSQLTVTTLDRRNVNLTLEQTVRTAHGARSATKTLPRSYAAQPALALLYTDPLHQRPGKPRERRLSGPQGPVAGPWPGRHARRLYEPLVRGPPPQDHQAEHAAGPNAALTRCRSPCLRALYKLL